MSKKISVSTKLKRLKNNKKENNVNFLKNHQMSDISQLSNEKLWKESEELKNNISISFIELGKRLLELQKRYSKNKSGSFQKICIEKGWKKTEVQTLIIKYNEYNELKNNGRDATDKEKIAFKIESASQKTMGELKKAPIEVKEMFINGEVNGAVEIRKATNQFNAKEFIEAEIIETEDEKNERIKQEISNLDKDIKERERNLKKLKKEREELLRSINS